MLTGFHLVVVGGDARQYEVIRQMAALDPTLTLVGLDAASEALQGLDVQHVGQLSTTLFRSADALLLPAMSCDEYGQVTTNHRLSEELLAALPAHAIVYCGVAHPWLKARLHKEQLVEILARDDVAILNSIPTAEGAIKIAIEHTPITIHGSKCVVLGMGRTGFTLARTLQGLGAHVAVCVRRAEQVARAHEQGFAPFLSGELEGRVSNIDLIFNTIPSMMLTAHVIAKMDVRTVIIDLASKPGGTDFRYAEKRGMKAFLALGLPGIVAPVTAGRVIAGVLAQACESQNERRRNARE